MLRRHSLMHSFLSIFFSNSFNFIEPDITQAPIRRIMYSNYNKRLLPDWLPVALISQPVPSSDTVGSLVFERRTSTEKWTFCNIWGVILTKFSGKSSLCEKRHLGKQIWQRHVILKEKTLFRFACVAQKHLCLNSLRQHENISRENWGEEAPVHTLIFSRYPCYLRTWKRLLISHPSPLASNIYLLRFFILFRDEVEMEKKRAEKCHIFCRLQEVSCLSFIVCTRENVFSLGV